MAENVVKHEDRYVLWELHNSTRIQVKGKRLIEW